MLFSTDFTLLGKLDCLFTTQFNAYYINKSLKLLNKIRAWNIAIFIIYATVEMK